mmetsp:Transcript_25250/g.38155  ORF Transcript_25250/g.38155 Transcript_25250/m.38155 type:complete len:303 (-) Transcript_25250:22-930(-)
MKFTFSVITTAMMVLASISSSTASASSDHHTTSSFTFIGNGRCVQAGKRDTVTSTNTHDIDDEELKMYDYVKFTNIDDLELCGSSRYCGHPKVRGFSYDTSDKGNCLCYFDHGYDMNTIPADMKSLQGFGGEFVSVAGTTKNNNLYFAAVGEINESDEADDDDDLKCYSNNNYQDTYKLIGDGACANDKNELYSFVSYDNVMNLGLCGSPVYCGRPQVRGFAYDDVHHCICYFEDGWNLDRIPRAMRELPGYNVRGAYFGNTATGEITGSDEGSLFRKCYANRNFTFRTIQNLRGIGLQMRR